MKRMKMLDLAVMAAVALVSFAPVAQAASAPDAVKSFAAAGTAIGATNAYCIVSANGVGAPKLEYLSATSDKAGSKVLFYVSSAGVGVTTATNTAQATVYAPGTGNFAANDIVVYRHFATDTYERLVVSSAAAGSITFTGNIAAASAAGDVVYKQTSTGVGSIPVGNATKEVTMHGGGMFYGKEGYPLYFEIDSTSAGSINLATGIFSKLRQ